MFPQRMNPHEFVDPEFLSSAIRRYFTFSEVALEFSAHVHRHQTNVDPPTFKKLSYTLVYDQMCTKPMTFLPALALLCV